MNKSQDLVQFFNYLEKNPRTKFIKEFEVRAVLASKPPSFFRTLPVGDAILYPDYLVFLTLDTNKPGYKLLFNELFDKIKAVKNVYGWVTEPASIVEFLIERLPESLQEEDTVEKLFSNPNSFFIPLRNNVKVVESGLKFIEGQGHYIKIKTRDKSIILCQDALRDQRRDPLKGFVDFLQLKQFRVGEWHPDVVEILKKKIKV